MKIITQTKSKMKKNREYFINFPNPYQKEKKNTNSEISTTIEKMFSISIFLFFFA